MCGNGASLICVHNGPIVSLPKPITLLNGKHKKIRARICRSFKGTRYRFSAWRAGTKPYLSYWPARLHRLAKSIPRNRCLGSISVYKYGFCTVSSTEAEFLDVIGAKVSRIFQGYSLVTSTSWAKVVLKLVGNVNIVYGNLKSENSKIMDRNLNEIVRSWIRLRFALLHSFPWFTHGNFGLKVLFPIFLTSSFLS